MSTSPLVQLDAALRADSELARTTEVESALQPQPATQYESSRHTGPLDETDAIVPPVPETLDETGLPGSMIEHLILKLLYSRGELTGRDLSKAVGLKFSVVEEFIEFLKRQHLIQAKGSWAWGTAPRCSL